MVSCTDCFGVSLRAICYSPPLNQASWDKPLTPAPQEQLVQVEPLPPQANKEVDSEEDFPNIIVNLGPGVSIHAFSHAVRSGLSDASPSGGDSTGTTPWYGGLLLAAWLAHEPQELFSHRRVIELGCGSAAMPSVAWRLRSGGVGGEEVVATDTSVTCVRSARLVLEGSGVSSPSCTARCLAWEDDLADADLNAWGVILFADVLYKEFAAPLLAAAVSRLLWPGGVVLGTVGLHRSGSWKIFYAMRDRGFIAEEVEISDIVQNFALQASVRLLQTHERNEATMGSMSGPRNACKLVRWVQRGAANHTERDMTEMLHQQIP